MKVKLNHKHLNDRKPAANNNATLPPRTLSIKPWTQLSAEEKKIESRKMELYAAMVDNLDYHNRPGDTISERIKPT